MRNNSFEEIIRLLRAAMDGFANGRVSGDELDRLLAEAPSDVIDVLLAQNGHDLDEVDARADEAHAWFCRPVQAQAVMGVQSDRAPDEVLREAWATTQVAAEAGAAPAELRRKAAAALASLATAPTHLEEDLVTAAEADDDAELAAAQGFASVVGGKAVFISHNADDLDVDDAPTFAEAPVCLAPTRSYATSRTSDPSHWVGPRRARRWAKEAKVTTDVVTQGSLMLGGAFGTHTAMALESLAAEYGSLFASIDPDKAQVFDVDLVFDLSGSAQLAVEVEKAIALNASFVAILFMDYMQCASHEPLEGGIKFAGCDANLWYGADHDLSAHERGWANAKFASSADSDHVARDKVSHTSGHSDWWLSYENHRAFGNKAEGMTEEDGTVFVIRKGKDTVVLRQAGDGEVLGSWLSSGEVQAWNMRVPPGMAAAYMSLRQR